MMKRVLSATLAMTMVATAGVAFAAEEGEEEVSMKRNVMYYGDWSVWGGQGNFYPQHMPTDTYTHLNYAFLDFDAAGNLIMNDMGAALETGLEQEGIWWGATGGGILPTLRTLRAEDPNMKIGISIGGWSKSGDFSEMAASDTARAHFVESMMKFMIYTDMDFIDVDWEYPCSVREADLTDNKNDEGTPNSKPEDKENYIKLLSDLRAGLDALGKKTGKTYELSVALPMNRNLMELGIDLGAMFEIIDFGNIMTYDARGAFDPITGHHAALYGNPADPYYDSGFSADQVVQYLLEQGVPGEKIVIGAAFYSRGWEKVANTEIVDGLPGLFAEAEVVNQDGDGSPSRGAQNDLPVVDGDGGRHGGIWAYRNFDKLEEVYPDMVEYWDDVAKAPYLYNGSTFLTYDNGKSITEKAKYVNENQLGGMITWMAPYDKVTDVENQRDELSYVLYNALYEGEDLPNHTIISPVLDVAVTVTATETGYYIKVDNNEIPNEETNDLLAVLESKMETIQYPILYLDNSEVEVTADGVTVTKMEDGRLALDLKEVAAITPAGESFGLSVHYADASAVSIENLRSIALGQRILPNGVEVAYQSLDLVKGEESDLVLVAQLAPTSITVDETEVAVDAYVINNETYYKLRDLGAMLNGTEKNFEIHWNQELQRIEMRAKTPYTSVGGELVVGATGAAEATVAQSEIYVNDQKVDFTAYCIGENNYFRLRDIMAYFDIGVTYDPETTAISLDTSSSYEEK